MNCCALSLSYSRHTAPSRASYPPWPGSPVSSHREVPHTLSGCGSSPLHNRSGQYSQERLRHSAYCGGFAATGKPFNWRVSGYHQHPAQPVILTGTISTPCDKC